MVIKLFLVSLILAVAVFAESIEFSFGNQANSGTFYEFDVMVRAGNAGTRLGDALIYLNYSTAGFGSNVVASGNIEVTKVGVLEGELVPGSGLKLYEIVNIIDNANGRVAITTGYLYSNAAASANELTTTAQRMLHIKLAIVNTSATAGLSFENPAPPAQPTMLGQQYQSDNIPANKYNPVIANDTDNSALNPILVDLVSFTLKPSAAGVLLEWETASEINHAGFHIYRSKNVEDNYTRINESLILTPSGNSHQGASYRYMDRPAEYATYYYKLQSLSLDGTAVFHPAVQAVFSTWVTESIPLPTEFKLNQNYPNPFNPETHISYHIPSEVFVDIAIYNVHGQKVKQLVQEIKSAGFYLVVWDGQDSDNNPVGSGIYILSMKAADFQENKRVTLLR